MYMRTRNATLRAFSPPLGKLKYYAKRPNPHPLDTLFTLLLIARRINDVSTFSNLFLSTQVYSRHPSPFFF